MNRDLFMRCVQADLRHANRIGEIFMQSSLCEAFLSEDEHGKPMVMLDRGYGPMPWYRVLAKRIQRVS